MKTEIILPNFYELWPDLNPGLTEQLIRKIGKWKMPLPETARRPPSMRDVVKAFMDGNDVPVLGPDIFTPGNARTFLDWLTAILTATEEEPFQEPEFPTVPGFYREMVKAAQGGKPDRVALIHVTATKIIPGYPSFPIEYGLALEGAYRMLAERLRVQSLLLDAPDIDSLIWLNEEAEKCKNRAGIIHAMAVVLPYHLPLTDTER
ncbi:MAG: hypothetical protein N2691_04155 [Patescibacteria group bacterium]|nr:hypothetical protein [Patescibacteria group bacterium]